MGRDASGLSDSLSGEALRCGLQGALRGALVRSEASGGIHDGPEDLAGGNENKEAGTPHPPLLDLSSALANLAALGAPAHHPNSSSGDP